MKFSSRYSTISRAVDRYSASLSFLSIVIIELLFLSGYSQAMPMQLLFPGSGEEVTPTTNGRLCEKYRYFHNETETCYKSKHQGPCPKSMIFYAVDKIYGDCDCAEVNHSRVFVYDISSNQCFKTFHQAYCHPGEWLILNNNSIPTCVPNKCQKLYESGTPQENEDHPVVLLNNKCVRLLKSDPEFCASPHEVTVDTNTGIPICSSSLGTAEYDLGVKGSFKCRPGTRRDRLGKCRSTNTKVSFSPSSSS
ncbi:hypothetical protein Ocin01_07846 [Orchesella cincta]|uniref:DUF4789 domain-containing protein n=1 Tax=Orchesella cincta TaxID=48709 RepID=A0A1D2N1R4_ORCCI|nr:hypothetical protein Ocin01_07846 [Orchesella cincta]